MSMIERVINVLFPKSCPICEKVLDNNRFICKECESEIRLIKEPRCQKCGKSIGAEDRLFCDDCKNHTHLFDKGISVFQYQGGIRQSLYRFKYHNAREYAEFYSRVGEKLYGEIIEKWHVDVVIPVPMYKEKERKRGYNQAVVFAKALAKYICLPVKKDLLLRIKNTAPQKGLSDEMRYQNLRDAFAVNMKKMKGIKRILLVDDIYTTGSTMDACAAILKKAGAEKVYVLCISAGLNC